MKWINPNESTLSLNRQLELATLSKSSYYYEPIGESQLNLSLMEEIDRIYTKAPFFGSRRILAELNRKGFCINRKRVSRLMRKMGLAAVFPQASKQRDKAEIIRYPYLLEGVSIEEVNQAWSTDITYIPTAQGFLYLTAVMDWFSRFILSWKLSNTMDIDFCLEALGEAFCFGKPKVFTSDQGSQYTSKRFVEALEQMEVQISMSGKGRCYDNIFVERLWRSVKYEEVYLRRYQSGKEAYDYLKAYIEFYNNERPHQSLNYKTPAEVYFEKQNTCLTGS